MEHGFLGLEISFGDTPTCSLLDDWGDVDEARPGNFVFYNLTQMAIGSCTAADIGFVVACPVVAVHADRHEIVLYGGAVQLSKDVLMQEDAHALLYGAVVPLHGPAGANRWQAFGCARSRRSAGVVRAATAAAWPQLADVGVGDLLGVVPVHSCLTADLLKEYVTLSGEHMPMLRIE